jgi:hypothetical protein
VLTSSLAAPTPPDISYYTPPEQDPPTPTGLDPPAPLPVSEDHSLCSPVAADAVLLDYPLDLVEPTTPQPVLNAVSSLSNNFASRLVENIAPISSPPRQPRQEVVQKKGKCLRCSLLNLEVRCQPSFLEQMLTPEVLC